MNVNSVMASQFFDFDTAGMMPGWNLEARRSRSRMTLPWSICRNERSNM